MNPALKTAATVICMSTIPLAAGASDAHFMPVGKATTIPIGHHGFCARNPMECRPLKEVPGPEVLNDVLLAKLAEVNARVNKIPAKSDKDIFGKDEYWAYPRDAADCEDFALLKRRILVNELGFSPSNVLMTVVKRKTNDEGHAILTVRTTDGDYVLDNLNSDVRLWSDAAQDYNFSKRQSSTHAGLWVLVEPSGAIPETASAKGL